MRTRRCPTNTTNRTRTHTPMYSFDVKTARIQSTHMFSISKSSLELIPSSSVSVMSSSLLDESKTKASR